MLWYFVLHSPVILFHIIFHYNLSQDIKYSPLCYIVEPCYVPILYALVHI